jgi:hypothetical protein
LVPPTLALSFALVVAAVAFELGQRHPAVSIPDVPASLAPEHGVITEVWPNGETKSERIYRGGQIVQACYCSSDGEVVFEMTSKTPEQDAVKK